MCLPGGPCGAVADPGSRFGGPEPAGRSRGRPSAGSAFLRDPSVQVADCRAGQAIRSAVVTRKVCGGDRTRKSAATQQVLAYVVHTATTATSTRLRCLRRCCARPTVCRAPAVASSPDSAGGSHQHAVEVGAENEGGVFEPAARRADVDGRLGREVCPQAVAGTADPPAGLVGRDHGTVTS